MSNHVVPLRWMKFTLSAPAGQETQQFLCRADQIEGFAQPSPEIIQRWPAAGACVYTVTGRSYIVDELFAQLRSQLVGDA